MKLEQIAEEAGIKITKLTKEDARDWDCKYGYATPDYPHATVMGFNQVNEAIKAALSEMMGEKLCELFLNKTLK